MLERQRERIARAVGPYKDGDPTARARAHEVGDCTLRGRAWSKFAARLGLGVDSVHRALNGTTTSAIRPDG